MGLARQDASASLKAKREAYTKGLDERIAYYSQADERKQEAKIKAIKSLLSQGVSPEEIDPNVLGQYAKAYGVSVEDLTAGYAEEKKLYDQEVAEQEAKSQFNLSDGQARYDASGNLIAENTKNFAPKTTSSTTKAPTIAVQKTAIADTLKTGIAPSGDKLGAPKGGDGYSDPYVYIEAFNNWGGTAKDFLNYFTSYYKKILILYGFQLMQILIVGKTWF